MPHVRIFSVRQVYIILNIFEKYAKLPLMYEQTFYITQIVMVVLGACSCIALYFIPAGYGKWAGKNWGFSFNNKVGWVLMEIPTLIAMIVILTLKGSHISLVRVIIASFFLLHYVQRTLIFPFLIHGKGKMPLLIVLMGMLFNSINALLIGSWLFYFSPPEMYGLSWLYDPRFIIGAVIFFTGMGININSDSYIRSLRKPGDSAHYFPNKRMYRYVTSANYFGELLEWTGFAILSWSAPGVLFVYWTAANLVPRAHMINKKYKKDFPEEFAVTKPKRILPFIY